ncbi:hypothetical protein Pcinc_016549 [Petrolisthes cinctipes]|uniref:Uncharacterized protein n=1 Tax=Petrolisthes cinctipes TaxID=88211 RepID=A0AAE1FQY8_PETCI|nr:hypothetical protein Pcinc_016549 [Petrolisthes cinctipes]
MRAGLEVMTAPLVVVVWVLCGVVGPVTSQRTGHPAASQNKANPGLVFPRLNINAYKPVDREGPQGPFYPLGAHDGDANGVEGEREESEHALQSLLHLRRFNNHHEVRRRSQGVRCGGAAGYFPTTHSLLSSSRFSLTPQFYSTPHPAHSSSTAHYSLTPRSSPTPFPSHSSLISLHSRQFSTTTPYSSPTPHSPFISNNTHSSSTPYSSLLPNLTHPSISSNLFLTPVSTASHLHTHLNPQLHSQHFPHSSDQPAFTGPYSLLFTPAATGYRGRKGDTYEAGPKETDLTHRHLYTREIPELNPLQVRGPPGNNPKPLTFTPLAHPIHPNITYSVPAPGPQFSPSLTLPPHFPSHDSHHPSPSLPSPPTTHPHSIFPLSPSHSPSGPITHAAGGPVEPAQLLLQDTNARPVAHGRPPSSVIAQPFPVVPESLLGTSEVAPATLSIVRKASNAPIVTPLPLDPASILVSGAASGQELASSSFFLGRPRQPPSYVFTTLPPPRAPVDPASLLVVAGYTSPTSITVPPPGYNPLLQELQKFNIVHVSDDIQPGIVSIPTPDSFYPTPSSPSPLSTHPTSLHHHQDRGAELIIPQPVIISNNTTTFSQESQPILSLPTSHLSDLTQSSSSSSPHLFHQIQQTYPFLRPQHPTFHSVQTPRFPPRFQGPFGSPLSPHLNYHNPSSNFPLYPPPYPQFARPIHPAPGVFLSPGSGNGNKVGPDGEGSTASVSASVQKEDSSANSEATGAGGYVSSSTTIVRGGTSTSNNNFYSRPPAPSPPPPPLGGGVGGGGGGGGGGGSSRRPPSLPAPPSPSLRPTIIVDGVVNKTALPRDVFPGSNLNIACSRRHGCPTFILRRRPPVPANGDFYPNTQVIDEEHQSRPSGNINIACHFQHGCPTYIINTTPRPAPASPSTTTTTTTTPVTTQAPPAQKNTDSPSIGESSSRPSEKDLVEALSLLVSLLNTSAPLHQQHHQHLGQQHPVPSPLLQVLQETGLKDLSDLQYRPSAPTPINPPYIQPQNKITAGQMGEVNPQVHHLGQQGGTSYKVVRVPQSAALAPSTLPDLLDNRQTLTLNPILFQHHPGPAPLLGKPGTQHLLRNRLFQAHLEAVQEAGLTPRPPGPLLSFTTETPTLEDIHMGVAVDNTPSLVELLGLGVQGVRGEGEPPTSEEGEGDPQQKDTRQQDHSHGHGNMMRRVMAAAMFGIPTTTAFLAAMGAPVAVLIPLGLAIPAILAGGFMDVNSGSGIGFGSHFHRHHNGHQHQHQHHTASPTITPTNNNDASNSPPGSTDEGGGGGGENGGGGSGGGGSGGGGRGGGMVGAIRRAVGTIPMIANRIANRMGLMSTQRRRRRRRRRDSPSGDTELTLQEAVESRPLLLQEDLDTLRNMTVYYNTLTKDANNNNNNNSTTNNNNTVQHPTREEIQHHRHYLISLLNKLRWRNGVGPASDNPAEEEDRRGESTEGIEDLGNGGDSQGVKEEGVDEIMREAGSENVKEGGDRNSVKDGGNSEDVKEVGDDEGMIENDEGEAMREVSNIDLHPSSSHIELRNVSLGSLHYSQPNISQATSSLSPSQQLFFSPPPPRTSSSSNTPKLSASNTTPSLSSNTSLVSVTPSVLTPKIPSPPSSTTPRFSLINSMPVSNTTPPSPSNNPVFTFSNTPSILPPYPNIIPHHLSFFNTTSHSTSKTPSSTRHPSSTSPLPLFITPQFPETLSQPQKKQEGTGDALLSSRPPWSSLSRIGLVPDAYSSSESPLSELQNLSPDVPTSHILNHHHHHHQAQGSPPQPDPSTRQSSFLANIVPPPAPTHHHHQQQQQHLLHPLTFPTDEAASLFVPLADLAPAPPVFVNSPVQASSSIGVPFPPPPFVIRNPSPSSHSFLSPPAPSDSSVNAPAPPSPSFISSPAPPSPSLVSATAPPPPPFVNPLSTLPQQESQALAAVAGFQGNLPESLVPVVLQYGEGGLLGLLAGSAPSSSSTTILGQPSQFSDYAALADALLELEGQPQSSFANLRPAVVMVSAENFQEVSDAPLDVIGEATASEAVQADFLTDVASTTALADAISNFITNIVDAISQFLTDLQDVLQDNPALVLLLLLSLLLLPLLFHKNSGYGGGGGGYHRRRVDAGRALLVGEEEEEKSLTARVLGDITYLTRLYQQPTQSHLYDQSYFDSPDSLYVRSFNRPDRHYAYNYNQPGNQNIKYDHNYNRQNSEYSHNYNHQHSQYDRHSNPKHSQYNNNNNHQDSHYIQNYNRQGNHYNQNSNHIRRNNHNNNHNNNRENHRISNYNQRDNQQYNLDYNNHSRGRNQYNLSSSNQNKPHRQNNNNNNNNHNNSPNCNHRGDRYAHPRNSFNSKYNHVQSHKIGLSFYPINGAAPIATAPHYVRQKTYSDHHNYQQQKDLERQDNYHSQDNPGQEDNHVNHSHDNKDRQDNSHGSHNKESHQNHTQTNHDNHSQDNQSQDNHNQDNHSQNNHRRTIQPLALFSQRDPKQQSPYNRRRDPFRGRPLSELLSGLPPTWLSLGLAEEAPRGFSGARRSSPRLHRTTPDHNSPDHTTRDHAIPGQTDPGHTTQEHSSPGHTTLVHTSQSHTSPDHTSPEQTMSSVRSSDALGHSPTTRNDHHSIIHDNNTPDQKRVVLNEVTGSVQTRPDQTNSVSSSPHVSIPSQTITPYREQAVLNHQASRSTQPLPTPGQPPPAPLSHHPRPQTVPSQTHTLQTGTAASQTPTLIHPVSNPSHRPHTDQGPSIRRHTDQQVHSTRPHDITFTASRSGVTEDSTVPSTSTPTGGSYSQQRYQFPASFKYPFSDHASAGAMSDNTRPPVVPVSPAVPSSLPSSQSHSQTYNLNQNPSSSPSPSQFLPSVSGSSSSLPSSPSQEPSSSSSYYLPSSHTRPSSSHHPATATLPQTRPSSSLTSTQLTSFSHRQASSSSSPQSSLSSQSSSLLSSLPQSSPHLTSSPPSSSSSSQSLSPSHPQSSHSPSSSSSTGSFVPSASLTNYHALVETLRIMNEINKLRQTPTVVGQTHSNTGQPVQSQPPPSHQYPVSSDVPIASSDLVPTPDLYFLNDAAKGASKLAPKITTAITDLVTNLGEAVGEFFSSIAEAISTFFQDIAKAINETPAVILLGLIPLFFVLISYFLTSGKGIGVGLHAMNQGGGYSGRTLWRGNALHSDLDDTEALARLLLAQIENFERRFLHDF